MPLDFPKRRGDKSQASADSAAALLLEDVEAEEHELKLTYRAKTSQGLRMAAGPNALDELPNMLRGEIDTSGYPEYDAIVGGVAFHWDEASGDMVVRGVVGRGAGMRMVRG